MKNIDQEIQKDKNNMRYNKLNKEKEKDKFNQLIKEKDQEKMKKKREKMKNID